MKQARADLRGAVLSDIEGFQEAIREGVLLGGTYFGKTGRTG